MRGISTISGASACLRKPVLDDCGSIVTEEPTEICFAVTDLPKYIIVCGLADKQLLLQRKWFDCGNIVVKTTPVLDATGQQICVSDVNAEILVPMPGHYLLSIKDEIDAPFPEDFMHQIMGVDFQFAKCWYEARR